MVSCGKENRNKKEMKEQRDEEGTNSEQSFFLYTSNQQGKYVEFLNG